MSRILHAPARTLHQAAFLVAFLALFVGLGGQGYAKAPKLARNSVTSKTIKNGQVSSSDLKDGGVKSADLVDGGVGLIDLSPALKAQLSQILDGSVTTAKLGDGSVTTPKLADGSVTNPKLGADSVTGPKVAANTLTSGDIASGAVGASELGPNSVSSDDIQNGTLDGVDIGKASGTTTFDFGSIGKGICASATAVVPGATPTDQVTVSPEADYLPDTQAVTVYGQASTINDRIRVVVCNISAASIDLPAVTFHYTVIDN
jgi:hypothetical protein